MAIATYLERLRIPVLDLLDRHHLIKSIGQARELLDTVGKANGQLFGEELGGAE